MGNKINLARKPKNKLLVSCFLLLLFSDILEVFVSPLFGYSDLLVIGVCAIWSLHILISTGKFFQSASDKVFFYSYLAFLVVGVISSFVNQFQGSGFAVVVDFASIARFAVAYLLIRSILRDEERVSSLVTTLVKLSKVIVVVLMFFAVISLVVDLGMSSGNIRFGLPSFMFLYGHPTNFAAAVVALLAILSTDRKHNTAYIIAAILVLFLTFRFKAIGIALIFILLLLFNSKKSKGVPWFLLVLGGVLTIVVAWNQILLYFGDNATARSVLLTTSLALASSTFPWGTGFATYGSPITATFYPDLYFQLGFNRVYGLTPEFPQYIADTFWPVVIGQFGWIGLFFFLLVVIAFFRTVGISIKEGRGSVPSLLLIPIYLVIASSSEPAFFATYSVLFAMVIAIQNSNVKGIT